MVKARRTLWVWGAVVLALHLAVLLNLPSRQSTLLMAPAMAHTFSTRTVELPVPAPVPAPAAVAVSAPAPALAPAARSKPPPARPMPRRAPEQRTVALSVATTPLAGSNGTTLELPEARSAAGLEGLDQRRDSAASHLPPDAEWAALAEGGVLVASAETGPEAGTAATATTPDPGAAPAAAPPAADPPESANALAIFAPGAEQPQSGPAPAVQPPAPQLLKFDVTGQAKRLQYSARAELLWQHDGQRYQARQEISLMLLGARTQTSNGTLGPAGLQPERFADRARSEKAAHFDYAQQRVTFSTNAPDAPLAAGTQDRLSVFVQLGALLAAAPERYPVGTRIRLDTAGTGAVDAWAFTVEGEEMLELPLGSLRTLRLQRMPRPGHDYDQKAQLWLAPTLGYLPARIRLTQANGDFADLQLTSHKAP